MNITDMTPEQLDEVVAAETRAILAKGCGLYPGMEVRHVKSGRHYTVVCEAMIEATLMPVVVYRAESDQTIWVRPTEEFCDGRFVGR